MPRTSRRRANASSAFYNKQGWQFGEFVDVEQAKQQARAFAKQRRAMFKLPLTEAPERGSGAKSASSRGQGALLSLAPSYNLARRFEALMRAAQYPARQAQRLARWLACHRTCAALFTQPTRSYYSLQRKPGDHAIADAAHFAREAWAVCDSS